MTDVLQIAKTSQNYARTLAENRKRHAARATESKVQSPGAPRKPAATVQNKAGYTVNAGRLRLAAELLTTAAGALTNPAQAREALALAEYFAGRLDARGVNRATGPSPAGRPLARYVITWANGSQRYEMGLAATALALGIKANSLATAMSRGNGTYTKRAWVSGNPSVVSCQKA